MREKIKDIYIEVYHLFKEDTDKEELQYVRRSWIFPNHIEVMIEIIKKMTIKYNGDLEICILATILHDTGLVYKREKSSPAGHEKRSVEYAQNLLSKHGYSQDKVAKITDCIKATQASSSPKTINEKIVRTADSLSQFTSIHFFAKAAFSGDIYKNIKWLEDKIETNYQKLCFEDEINQAKPVKKYILGAIKMHHKYNKKLK